jgi:hypothetical protein
MFQPAVYRADDPAVAAARARITARLRAGVGQRAAAPTSDAAFGAWAFVRRSEPVWGRGGTGTSKTIEGRRHGPPAVSAALGVAGRISFGSE